MEARTEAMICPKGHVSAEPDYCSECGAKMLGSGGRSAGAAGGAAAGGAEICPDCGTAREQTDIAFCEVCGFNFRTGAHGELGMLPSGDAAVGAGGPEPEVEAAEVVSLPVSPVLPAAPVPVRWSVQVSVDASLGAAESPAPPAGFAAFTVELEKPVSLIGRPNEARGITPEVALPFDEAVSRRHALLQGNGQGGLLLRDIGAANGTRLNGKALDPMVDYPVQPGDRITLGHWTCLALQASA